MARVFGKILSRIWDDPEFLALGEGEQRMYLFLLSQSNLNHAGLLPLTLRRWARKAAGLSPALLEARLQHLEAARFVVIDYDTEELLVRTLVRNDDVWKQPRVMGAMVSGAQEIASARLRWALLAEVERIPLGELSDEPGAKGAGSIRSQVAAHMAALRVAFGPVPTPPQPPRRPVAQAPAEPLPEGDAEGLYARARGDARRAPAPARAAPAPSPTPAPTPLPPSAGRTAPRAARALRAVPDEAEEPTAQVILGEYLERCAKRPPGAVIGQLGKLLRAMLAEGVDPDDIRRGMAAWKAKGLHPATLPAVVNEVMNAAPPRPAPRHASNDAFLPGAMARAQAREAATKELA